MSGLRPPQELRKHSLNVTQKVLPKSEKFGDLRLQPTDCTLVHAP